LVLEEVLLKMLQVEQVHYMAVAAAVQQMLIQQLQVSLAVREQMVSYG
jgi:hypothetical protein